MVSGGRSKGSEELSRGGHVKRPIGRPAGVVS
jgi:hypothetical protein